MWMISIVVGMLLGVATGNDVDLADKAEQGEIEAVRSLLAGAKKINLNAAQADGMTALHWAAFNDDLEMAHLLLEHNANVDPVTRVGSITPLILASRNGSALMISLLLDAKADPNRASDTGATPLMAAAMAGDLAAVEALLKANADVNAREAHNGQTPLMFAAWKNRPDVIKLLVAHGAHPGVTSNILVTYEPRLDKDGNLLPRRKGSEQTGANAAMGGLTALLYAARDGHMEAVEALLEAGADIDQPSGSDASTPMVIAIANGHYTLGQYLLDRGADPRKANLDGVTALWATVNMRYAPVSWAPNPPTDQETVDSLDLIRSLLERGADPNARVHRKLWFSPSSHDRGWVEYEGGTPFWRAAMSSDVEVMRALVAGGADPNIATTGGATPLMVAAGLGWIGNFSQNAPDSWMEAVEYCLELGNDINATDEDGFTALHGAASRGDTEMVAFLLENGARVDVINKNGDSAADMAFGPSRFFIPRPETVELLVAHGTPFQNNCRSDQCVDGKFLGPAAVK